MGALVCYQYCTDHQTSDKRLFATFARTRPPDTHISKSVVAVLRAFNWTTVSQSSPNHPCSLPPSASVSITTVRARALSLSHFCCCALSNHIDVSPARERVTRDFIEAGRITFGAARLLFFALRPADTFLGLTAHFSRSEFGAVKSICWMSA